MLYIDSSVTLCVTEYIDLPEEKDVYYVYIVRCNDNTYYTGYTTDVEKRVQTHNEKKGAKYTRSRTPVELVYQEAMETKSLALQREAAIKRLSRREKEGLIRNFS